MATGFPPTTLPRPRLRRRLAGLPPVLRAGLLCGAAVVAVSAASADWKVERGDTLGEIALATGTSVRALADANDLADPDLILVGQRLRVPGDGDARDRPPRRSPGSSGSSSSGSSGSGEVATTVVRPGDGVAGLARRLGVSRDQFMAANGFTSPSQVLAGSRVRSHAGPPPGRGSAGATHRVRPGDTLEQIARAQGTSWRRLARANDLADPSLIVVGQRLDIPGSGGGFTCPVAGNPRFINDFGLPKGGGRYHEGIDLFARRGTPVLAPVSGRVEHVRGTRGGLQAHLFGDDGYRYWATHLDSLGPTGRVGAGDQLGTVGTTGNARGTSPHLHFEVYWQGRTVNTYPILRETC